MDKWWLPSDHDTSIDILQSFLTNSMPFSLHNAEVTIFQHIMYGFNVGMLSIGMVLFGYILYVGTIHSARDGVFLGKDWDSYWLPLRTVFGAIAVIPTKSGYCMAQWAIFNLVTMGVGFADYIWQDAYNAASNGAQAVVPSGLTQQIIDQNAYFLLYGLVVNAYESAQEDKVVSCTQENDEKSQMIFGSSGNNDPLNKCQYSYDVLLNGVNKLNINELLNIWQPTGNSKQYLYNFLPQNSGGMHNFLVNNFSQCIQLGNSVCGTMLNDQTDQLSYYQLGFNNMTVNAYFLVKANSKEQYVANYDNQIKNSGLNVTSQTQFSHQLSNITSTDPFKSSIDILQDKSGNKKVELDPKLLSTYSSDLIQKMTDQGVNKQSTDQISSTWWDADQKYLLLDQKLGNNLQALQKAFSDISYNMSTISSDVQIVSMTANIDLQKVSADTISSAEFTPDSNGIYNINGSSSLPSSISESSDVVKGVVNVTQENAPELWQLIASGQLKIKSSSDVLDKFSKIFGKTSPEYKLAGNLINDGLSAKALEYIGMITNVASTENQLDPKGAQNLLTTLIDLMAYFKNNYVSFVQSSSSSISDDSADVAKDVVVKMLNKLFSSQNNQSNQTQDSLTSILDEIYKFGQSKEDGGYTQDTYLQQLQNLGRDMINRSLNAYQNSYTYFSNKFADLQNAQKRAASISLGLNAGALGLGTLGSIMTAFATPITPDFGFGGMALQGIGKILQGSAQLNMAIATEDGVINLYRLMLQLMYLPILFVILSLIFINGIMFSLVLPLAPFFFFWAGKIAWLLLIVEALVAAPFVALGMVYPEGHEVFGKSQPGIQMAVNLFFRPALMIIGLVTSVTLTYVVVKCSAQAFHGIIGSMNFIAANYDATSNLSSGVIALCSIFVFVSFLAIVFNKCFSIIYLLPDKVLQWVGHSGGERAGEQEFQQIKSGAEGGAQQASQAGQKSADEGLSANKGHVMESGKVKSGVGEAVTGTLGGDSNAKLASSYVKQKRKHDDENGRNENYEQK